MTVRNWVTLGLLGAMLCYALVNRAGLDRAAWLWSLLCAGLIGSVHFIWKSRYPEPQLDSATLLNASVFLLFAAVQVVPLPFGLVQILSPTRAALEAAVEPLLGPSKFITLSTTPDRTSDLLLTIAGYLLIALVVRSLTFRFESNPWMTAMPVLVIAAMEAVFGFFQAGGPGEAPAIGTYPDHDHYSCLLNLALPFAVLFPVALSRREQFQEQPPANRFMQISLVVLTAGALLMAVVYSQSRIGLVGAFASLLVAGSLAYFLRDWSIEFEVSSGWYRKAVPYAITALVLLLGFLILPTDPLIAQFSDLAKSDQISAETRLQIWRDTTRIIKAYPLFGCGLGGFESTLLRYKSAAPMAPVAHAHNDYLQVLAEFGVLGFTAGALLILRILYRTVRAARYAQSVDGRYLAIACAAAMVAMLLHSIVDFNAYFPGNAMVDAWIIGIACVNVRAVRPQRVRHAGSEVVQFRGRRPH